MNQFNLIFIIFLCSGLLTDNVRNGITKISLSSEQDTSQVSPIKPFFIKGLSNLNENKFPKGTADTLLTLSKTAIKNLPEVTELEYFNDYEFHAKYFQDRTFSKHFKTYILYIFEGGDCSPGLELLNIRGDSLLSGKILQQFCAWEHGEFRTGTIFSNDSTFTVIQNSWNNEYVKDSIQHNFISQEYRISSNGGFLMINQRKEVWNETGKNYWQQR